MLNKSNYTCSRDNKNPNTKSNTPYSRFLYAISNKETLDYYQRKFRHFLNYLEIDGNDISEQANNLYIKIKQEGNDSDWFRDILIDYIAYQKSRVSGKEITAGTLRNYYKPIKLFCDMNNILVNWKLVNRGMPSPRRAGQDRIPTLVEIHSILEFGDIRIKPIVLLMISSGIRVGAWEYLKWKHVTPLYDQDRVLLAAKLIVYAGEPEEYFTFMTPEAYKALEDWMNFRKSYGERISGDSWLMRDMWRTTDMQYGAKTGMAREPIQLQAGGVRSLIHRALFKQNIRPLLEQDQKRHEFKALHGFRKFYKTICEQVMKPANIELLMGHNLGISQSYYKPTQSQLLEDYIKVVNFLTIEKAFCLQQQVIILQQEKDVEIQNLRVKDRMKDEVISNISDKLMEITRKLNELENR